MKRIERWRKWLPRAPQTEAEKVRCPACLSSTVSSHWQRVGESVGWAAFWCDECKEGIQVSRVVFTDGRDASDGDFAEKAAGISWVNNG